VLLIALFCGVMILIPLDVFRWHLLAKPRMPVSSLGLVLFIAGWWIMILALKENAFAALAVKHLEGQKVIDSGVYGVVRHSMYAGRFSPDGNTLAIMAGNDGLNFWDLSTRQFWNVPLGDNIQRGA
jgi:hypothetical protein